ncbi:antibiotic biosynthesis monooxygenase [Candidatus Nitrosotenuis chungbukensis]|uniref:antibiotic biosynthesis monooxygenase family protein n=1 Tax=Candidatus Nitrosotenuis chungbukensis TaxID=1353246 RepID=UPI0005B28639|nr:antibiotic biosynthesis monooxygenase [Candidatus Nitrosotenuis chungbukensis]WKT57575.1 antibiotic biosynthesis monooxygenase [Candidatus Nitrosotenuis chungbukensis]
MYVALIDIELKENAEDEFKAWIAETNKVLLKLPGFVNRRLIKSDDGKHGLIVEFADKESHAKIHQTKEHDEIRRQLTGFLKKAPSPNFYQVISQ